MADPLTARGRYSTAYANAGRVVWLPLPERDMSKYAPADELAAIARDRYQADWILYADVDEFVCTQRRSLRTVLADADRDGVTLLDIPRRTMTGPLPAPDQRATEVLTLRIDRTVVPTANQQVTWDFPVPFVFLEVGGHLAIRASAIGVFASGVHSAVTTWGTSGTQRPLYPSLRHPWIRGIPSEGAQHRTVDRGQPAPSSRMGLALATLDSAREGRAVTRGLRTAIRLAGARHRAGAEWHLRATRRLPRGWPIGGTAAPPAVVDRSSWIQRMIRAVWPATRSANL